MTEREREFRRMFKMMATKDPELLAEETEANFGELMVREIEEKRGDRIYFVVLAIEKMTETWAFSLASDVSDEEMIEAGLLDVLSGFGRFGLAVLNGRKDPFSRMEQTMRAVALMVEHLKQKEAEAVKL